MFNRPMFKRIRHIFPETLASTAASTDYKTLSSTELCNITGYTTRFLGSNYYCTIECTTGALYVRPSTDTEAPTSTNAFKVSEGGVLDLCVKGKLNIGGDSTTAKYQGIVWGDDL